MATRMFHLHPHPHRPASAVRGVRVKVIDTEAHLLLTFSVEGAGSLLIPPVQFPQRADELWKTTCFELFLQPARSAGYVEFNFSPSSRWAAYRFEDYRAEMCPLPLEVEPFIVAPKDQEPFELEIDLERDATISTGDLRMGISAVIEETGAAKSYWALAHAPGPPDFHNRDCFIATLSAPNAP